MYTFILVSWKEFTIAGTEKLEVFFFLKNFLISYFKNVQWSLIS